MPGGKKLTKVQSRKVSTTLPEAEFSDMVRMIEATKRFNDPADLARQLIREAIAKWKKDAPQVPTEIKRPQNGDPHRAQNRS